MGRVEMLVPDTKNGKWNKTKKWQFKLRINYKMTRELTRKINGEKRKMMKWRRNVEYRYPK